MLHAKINNNGRRTNVAMHCYHVTGAVVCSYPLNYEGDYVSAAKVLHSTSNK